MIGKKIFSILTAAAIVCGGVDCVSAQADENSISAHEIVAGMTLEQKITQMIMLQFRYWSDDGGEKADLTSLNQPVADLLEKYSLGGVILYAENVKGTEQTARLTSELQAAAAKNECKIPLFIAADQEGGTIIRLGTGTNTCGNMALGATFDANCAYENADIIGSELAAVGINVDFAPDMDVNSNPKNPIINVRSFSSDPTIVSEMGKAYISGMKNNNIIGSAKHFPGHGDTDVDSHTGLPLIDKSYEELKKCDLIPFQAAADAGVDMIMTTHIQFPQIETGTYTSISTGEEVYLPATLSKTILTDILRGDMGYDGVIITDGMIMSSLTENFDIYDTAELSINAGADILLVPMDTYSTETIEAFDTYVDIIEEKVESGKISEDRINESAERIIDLKLKRGLFNYDYENEDVEAKVANALATVGSYDHHERELAVTNKAITLIKNEGDVLPLALNEDEKILFFYANGNADKSFNFAFDRLKKDGFVPDGASVDAYFYPEKPAEDYEEALEKAKAVIINSDNWGEKYLAPSDDSNGAEAKFIDEMTALAHKKGKPVIIISTMFPYDAGRFTDADAFMIAYGNKMMGEIPTSYTGEVKAYGPNLISAIITVFGGNEPTGKLPVDVYEINSEYKYTDKVLYPVGFGLTYKKESESEPEKPENTEQHTVTDVHPVYNSTYSTYAAPDHVAVIRGNSGGSSATSSAVSSADSGSGTAPAPAAAPTPTPQTSTETNPATGHTGVWALSALALVTATVFAGKRKDK